MALADFFDRIGNNFAQNFENAGPQGLASLGAAIASAPRRQWGAGLAQGLAQFKQAAEQGKRKKSLAEALKGMSEGMTPQQKILFEHFPDLAAQEAAKSAFEPKPSGPYAGNSFDAQVANMLARGEMDPNFRNTPEYKLAKEEWVKAQLIPDAEGRTRVFRRSLPGGGAPAASPSAAPQAARPTAGPVSTFEPDDHPDLYASAEQTVIPGVGTMTTLPDTGKTPTEGQQKAQVFYTKMKGAEETLSDPNAQKLYMDSANWLARQGGEATEWLQGPEAQTFSTAARDWLAASLRYESGAQITRQDIEQLGPAYIPESGDSPQRLAYKKAARARAAEALRGELTPQQAKEVLLNLAKNPTPSLQKQFPAPPQEAIRDLKMRRDKAAFDEVFGPGAADKYLGK